MEHVEYSNHFVVDDHVIIEDDGNDDDVEAVTMVDVKNVVQVRLRHYDVIKMFGHAYVADRSSPTSAAEEPYRGADVTSAAVRLHA